MRSTTVLARHFLEYKAITNEIVIQGLHGKESTGGSPPIRLGGKAGSQRLPQRHLSVRLSPVLPNQRQQDLSPQEGRLMMMIAGRTMGTTCPLTTSHGSGPHSQKRAMGVGAPMIPARMSLGSFTPMSSFLNFFRDGTC